MPLPGWLARFNRRVTNPALRPVAGRLPYFGVVVHRGRTTGRVYRTPVTAFPYRDGFLIALIYGREVDWVKNVIAEGGCRLIHRRRAVDLTGPRVLLLQEVQAIPFPGWIRGILQLLRVDEVCTCNWSVSRASPVESSARTGAGEGESRHRGRRPRAVE